MKTVPTYIDTKRVVEDFGDTCACCGRLTRLYRRFRAEDITPIVAWVCEPCVERVDCYINATACMTDAQRTSAERYATDALWEAV